jgi:phosphomethylpyrimidine synthase
VREYAAQKELDEEAALNAGMKEKAQEFIASGAQVYQGNLPEGVELEH